jgi:hypothetical protein
VNNSSGKTTIKVVDTSSVHVQATRHFSVDNQPPEIQFTKEASGVSLNMPDNRPTFGQGNWVEYDILVPAGVQVNGRTSSGALQIDGVQGPVTAESNSGAVTLSNLSGDVQVKTNSGRIRASQLRHLRQAESSSGSINLDGIFTDPAQIRASSGSVDVKFALGSAVNLDVRTGSGSISQHGVSLASQQRSDHALSGTLGSPVDGTKLSIQTSSGSVTLSNQ